MSQGNTLSVVCTFSTCLQSFAELHLNEPELSLPLRLNSWYSLTFSCTEPNVDLFLCSCFIVWATLLNSTTIFYNGLYINNKKWSSKLSGMIMWFLNKMFTVVPLHSFIHLFIHMKNTELSSGKRTDRWCLKYECHSCSKPVRDWRCGS